MKDISDALPAESTQSRADRIPAIQGKPAERTQSGDQRRTDRQPNPAGSAQDRAQADAAYASCRPNSKFEGPAGTGDRYEHALKKFRLKEARLRSAHATFNESGSSVRAALADGIRQAGVVFALFRRF